MGSTGKRVVVVGTCASGKSTLVAKLRAAGVDAYVVAQEHSEVAMLWNHASPDVLVLLEADLATIRRRRHSADWPEAIYRAQLRRLTNAHANADLIVDTARYDEAATTELVLEALGIAPIDLV